MNRLRLAWLLTKRYASIVLFVLVLELGLDMSLASLVHAAMLNVDTAVDDAALTACEDAASNDCSLRGAIIKANGLSEASTINLPAGTYVLTQGNNRTFTTTQFGINLIQN
jgi:hypothetical protein